MATSGFRGLVDFAGYPVGRLDVTPAASGFLGLVDFAGYPVGRLDSSFPAQFDGLRVFFHSVVNTLCLVAEVDAPAGMGGVIKVTKGASNYAVYLVDTADSNATPVRVNTTTGVKAVRIKT